MRRPVGLDRTQSGILVPRVRIPLSALFASVAQLDQSRRFLPVRLQVRVLPEVPIIWPNSERLREQARRCNYRLLGGFDSCRVSG